MILNLFTTPNWSLIGSKQLWVLAFTMAIVASLETLLCVEATDKLDPDKNVTPTNRELLAQGTQATLFRASSVAYHLTQVIVT